MKRVMFYLFVLTTIFLSVSCNKSSANIAEDGSIIIEVFTRYGSESPDEVYFRQKVEEFNNMNNGVKVVTDYVVQEANYLDKLRVSFANGDTPNVFLEYGGSRVKDYLEADALVNIQTYFDTDKAWYDSFYSSLFSDLKYDDYEGIWGVPFKSYTILLYYNKDIFAKNGLTPPETYEQLLAVCEKLKQAGIKPFQTGEKDIWRLGHLHNNIVYKTLGVGAAKRLADRTLSYDSPEMIGTYQKIYDMLGKGYLGTDILNTDYGTEVASFESEKSAMMWNGSWYVLETVGKEIYNKIGVVPFPYIDPKYKTHAQGGASDMLYISKLNKSEEEVEASIKFLKYITSEEYFRGLNEVAAAIPPVKFTPSENAPENPVLDEVFKILNSYEALGSDVQNSDPSSHMLDSVRNALQGLGMGNTPEECGKQIVERLNQ